MMKLLASEYEAENWTPFGETCGKSGEDGANTLSVPYIHNVFIYLYIQSTCMYNVPWLSLFL